MSSVLRKIKRAAPAVFILLGASALASPFSSANAQSQMMSSYSSGFYPGVVRAADEILKEDGASVFAAKALVLKGEALARLGRPEEAIESLDKSGKIVASGSRLDSVRLYWKGRALYETGQYSLASQSFFSAAEACVDGAFADEDNSVYRHSVFYLGKTRHLLKDYGGALHCFEFVAANGDSFAAAEYEEGCVKLCECALLSGHAEKTVRYADLLEKELFQGFTDEGKYKILLLRGQALEADKDYPGAYNAYTQVLSDGPASLAAAAMQKAYNVSSSHKKEVGQEPGAVLARAEELKKERPLLVSEFWTRLAIDAFNSMDYKRSLSYFKNAEEGASPVQRQAALLYTAEISFATSQKSMGGAAKDSLSILEGGWDACGFEQGKSFYIQGMALRARYSGLCADYGSSYEYAKTVLDSADKNISLKKSSAYWAALSLFNLGNYEQAASIAGVYGGDDSSFLLIKAKSLAKTGDYSGADSIFSSLAEKNALDSAGVVDWARTLIYEGLFSQAADAAERADGAEARYIQGVSYFNMREWKKAQPCFEKAAVGNGLEEKYKDLAVFYLGYSQYQLGEYSQASANLVKFAQNGRQSSLDWEAYTIASLSLVQTGRYSEASSMAARALSCAKGEEKTQQSVLLCAGIYTDMAQYDNAIDVLKPYSSRRNAFGFQCAFQEAQILVKKKDFAQADSLYASLASEKTAGAIAEEAAFRRGELFYTNGDYTKAAPLFEDYIKKYRGGQFYTASLYFAADSLAKSGNRGRAVLYFQQLADSADNSTYKYGAGKQLVSLYSEDKDYDSALDMARRLQKEYGEQALGDGIQNTIENLQSLKGGADSNILALEREYERKGGENTPEGRKTGTALAEAYFERGDSFEKAQQLAQTLLEKQREYENESGDGARNAMLLAQSYRDKNNNRQAAQMFLEAAQLERKAGNDDGAGRALYGAAEAFDAAGLNADSKATAESILRLYPESRYAENAKRFID